MAWTLDYGGVEKSFADWGLAEEPSNRTRSNMAPDLVTLNMPGPMDAAEAFTYGNAATIWRDRNVSTTPFSGGTKWFQGKATQPRRFASGQAESVAYQFAGPWFDFALLVFQQTWNVYTGDPLHLGTYSSSELFLGQKQDGSLGTTGDMIREAVQWAMTCGVNVQIGTIDPATQIPIYNTRDLTVAEVINQMLRWTPDVICWFDYTTTPPTFHARRQANLVNATMAASDRLISTLSLQPRYDLQLASVFLKFKTINTVDGTAWMNHAQDVYPPGATGRELGACVATVELQGFSQTNVTGELECASINAQGSASARLAWWKLKDPLFSSDRIDPATLTIGSATITDETGATVSLATYPNELVSGQAAAWMNLPGTTTPVATTKAIVKALATYDLYADAAHKILLEKGKTKELSVRIVATNGVSGSYSALQHFEDGETAPVGLAQDMYNARATLQYDGEVALVNDEVPSGLGMGNKLTINTGSVSYGNLLVQSISEDLGRGRISVQVGPPQQLGIQDLMELLRVNRYRLIYNNPLTRSTGKAQTGGNVQLGKATSKENTTTGLGAQRSQAVSAPTGSNTMIVRKDATAGEILVQQVVTATGVKDATKGSISAKLADCVPGAGGNGKDIALREIDVCVDGAPKKMIVLCSLPYAPP